MTREPRRLRRAKAVGDHGTHSVPVVNERTRTDHTSENDTTRIRMLTFVRRQVPGILLGTACGLLLAVAIGGLWRAHDLPGLEPGSTWAGWMEFLRSGAFGALVGGSAAIYSARKAYSGVRQNLEHTRAKDARAEQWARFERLWKWAESENPEQSAAAMTMLAEMIGGSEPLPTGMASMIMSLTGGFDDETSISPSGELVPTLSAHRRGVAKSSQLVNDASRVAMMYMANRERWLQNQPPVRLIPPPPDAIVEPESAELHPVPDEGVEFEPVEPVQLPLSEQPTHVRQVRSSRLDPADLPLVEGEAPPTSAGREAPPRRRAHRAQPESPEPHGAHDSREA